MHFLGLFVLFKMQLFEPRSSSENLTDSVAKNKTLMVSILAEETLKSDNLLHLFLQILYAREKPQTITLSLIFS